MTYTWNVTDLGAIVHSGLGTTDAITVNWGTPGVKKVALSVTGGGESASATRSALVFDVAVNGPAAGEPDHAYAFDAALMPNSTGFPVSYTWEATDLSPISHPGQGVTDAATFSWTTPGPKTVTVKAEVDGETAEAVHSIEHIERIDGGDHANRRDRVRSNALQKDRFAKQRTERTDCRPGAKYERQGCGNLH